MTYYEAMSEAPNDRRPVSNITPFGLRLQPELKRRLEEAAKANNNSLNTEISLRLEASLSADTSEAVPDFVTGQRLRKLEEAVEKLQNRIETLERGTPVEQETGGAPSKMLLQRGAKGED